MILDLGLPDMDGIEVCRELRRWTPNPVVVLSADGAEERMVAALDAGADDYVTKPFSMPELLARMRVAFRHRRVLASVVDPAVVTVGDLVVDTGARRAVPVRPASDSSRTDEAKKRDIARARARGLTSPAALRRQPPSGR